MRRVLLTLALAGAAIAMPAQANASLTVGIGDQNVPTFQQPLYRQLV